MFNFPGGSDGKASAYNAGDLDSIPGSGRSPGEGNGNSLQYSCLENPMDIRAWWAIQSIVSQRVGHDSATEHTSCNQQYTENKCCPGQIRLVSLYFLMKLRYRLGM